nr:hypothetical protein [Streptomyces clavuligerus]
MYPNVPVSSESELLASVARAAARRPVAPADLLILTELQLRLYRELRSTAARALALTPHSAVPQPNWRARVQAAISDIFTEGEEMAVFRQIYDHLANAALNDRQVPDQLLTMSSGPHVAGGAFLKRILRFAAGDAYPSTVQKLVADFLETTDERTLRAVLSQLAGMEWAIDPDDRHQRAVLNAQASPVSEGETEASRFAELGLAPDPASSTDSVLTHSGSSAWETPDHHRIRTWRRRYVEAHRDDLAWARRKADVHRRKRERLAPYRHPDGVEAAVVTQLRQEADRAASARLFQIGDSLGQMAMRRVLRRTENPTTPFDPAHLPASRGMLVLDTPLTLPSGRRIVGYVWGPWSPRAEEGWSLLRPDRSLKPVDAPDDDAPWTWVTALTCDRSLRKMPFTPYETLLARPGEVLEPETRLRDPDAPEQYRAGSGRLGCQELMLRHARALWELLTQHKRSTVRVLSHQVHQLKPSKRDAERRRGITDSGQVENWWVDPDAGTRFREQSGAARKSGSGRTLTVRYWRDEHERQQCPNSHRHTALETESPGSCPHYEITIPEHPVGPADAPWSDRLRRARLQPSAARSASRKFLAVLPWPSGQSRTATGDTTVAPGPRPRPPRPSPAPLQLVAVAVESRRVARNRVRAVPPQAGRPPGSPASRPLDAGPLLSRARRAPGAGASSSVPAAAGRAAGELASAPRGPLALAPAFPPARRRHRVREATGPLPCRAAATALSPFASTPRPRTARRPTVTETLSGPSRWAFLHRPAPCAGRGSGAGGLLVLGPREGAHQILGRSRPGRAGSGRERSSPNPCCCLTGFQCVM